MKNNGLARRFHRLWWVPLITGLVALSFGIWCFCSPEASLTVFAYIFAGAIVGAGVLNLCYAFTNSSLRTNWGWSLALGLLELICGIWLFTLPPETLAVAFAFAMGIWVLVAAINAICEAACFASYSTAWTIWMILLLIATVIFGFYFLINPLFGGIAGWLWIGCSLILFGIWRISLAFKIRSLNRML